MALGEEHDRPLGLTEVGHVKGEEEAMITGAIK